METIVFCRAVVPFWMIAAGRFFRYAGGKQAPQISGREAMPIRNTIVVPGGKG